MVEHLNSASDNIPGYDSGIESKASPAPTWLLIESCFRFDLGRPDAAANFLKGLPTPDVVYWINGSVSSPQARN